MNIAFYVSGKAGRLTKILEQKDDKVYKSTKLIFSDDEQNIFLKDMVKGSHIEYHCLNYQGIQKEDSKSKNLIMSDELLSLLQKFHIDYCFSFGAHILKGELLSVYENRIINFHPSVLPMFPGLRAIDQAINAQANLLGNTAHFIDSGVDTGPIIMQSVLSNSLFKAKGYGAVLDQQVPMFYQIYKWLKEDRLVVKEQAVVIKGANYQNVAFFPELET